MRVKFSDRLREARGAQSQVEVCNALDIKQGTYSTWELGKYEPPLEILVKLAEYYGVTADWLLGMPESRCTDETTAVAKLECAKKAFFKLTEAVKELEGAL